MVEHVKSLSSSFLASCALERKYLQSSIPGLERTTVAKIIKVANSGKARDAMTAKATKATAVTVVAK